MTNKNTSHGGYGITPMVLLPWKFFDNNRKDGGFPPGGVPESGANGQGVMEDVAGVPEGLDPLQSGVIVHVVQRVPGDPGGIPLRIGEVDIRKRNRSQLATGSLGTLIEDQFGMSDDLKSKIAISKSPLRVDEISQRIHIIRGHRVILDADLAELYEVMTGALNQAVKRNKGRFPEDFAFRLTTEEKEEVVTKCDNLAA